jgi:hypothetical protein
MFWAHFLRLRRKKPGYPLQFFCAAKKFRFYPLRGGLPGTAPQL